MYHNTSLTVENIEKQVGKVAPGKTTFLTKFNFSRLESALAQMQLTFWLV